MRRIASSVLLAGVALLALPSLAPGQSNVPPGNSEIDQYLPTVPDSEGDHPFGGGGGDEGTALPPSAAERLGAAGPAGAAALAVAEQTAPKVPGAAREAGSDGGQGAGTGGPDRSADESVAGTVVDALGSGDSGGMGLLLPILLGVVAGAGVFMLLRRRLGTGMNAGA